MADELDISKIKIGDIIYNIKDSVARSAGTVTANPTTTASAPDLTSISILDTAYILNATKVSGYDLDALTALINSAYVSEVTVSSMNTAIDEKVQKAIDALQFNKYYTGTTIPASALGDDGDIYLQQ